MSEQLGNILVGLSGLVGGVVISMIVYYINLKIGKKRRIFDERQKHVVTNAKAIAWNVTSAILICAWGIVIIIEGVKFSFFLMTGIWVLHCLSLIVTGAYYNSRN